MHKAKKFLRGACDWAVEKLAVSSLKWNVSDGVDFDLNKDFDGSEEAEYLARALVECVVDQADV